MDSGGFVFKFGGFEEEEGRSILGEVVSMGFRVWGGIWRRREDRV